MWLKQTFIALAFLLPIGLITLSNAGGRATVQNAGNTGAPGDNMVNGQSQMCISCHNGNNFGVSLDIEMIDGVGNAVTEYIPNSTYRLKVTVNSATGDPSKYAMQLVTLLDSNNEAINNNYSNPSSNTKIASASTTGRTYAEQVGASSTNTFEIDWTAPDTGLGSITFYSAGVAVNGNGTTGGDGASNTSMSVAEMISSTTDVLGQSFTFNNPVSNELNVKLDAAINFKSYEIYTINGKLIDSNNDNRTTSNLNIDCSQLTSGLHFLKVNTDKGVQTIKFVKQ